MNNIQFDNSSVGECHNTIENLTLKEIQLLYEIIRKCHNAKQPADIKYLILEDIKSLIPYEIAGYGIGEVPSCKIVNWVNMGFPEVYTDQVIQGDNILDSPIVKAWSQNLEPQFVNDEIIDDSYPVEWQQAFKESKIGNLLTHGLVDIAGRKTSYFCFAKFPPASEEKYKHLMEILVPHLHVVLISMIDNTIKGNNAHKLITQREKEILQSIYRGETNNDIGQQFSISEYTVKNHVCNILTKLGAANRAHAVAKAIEERIIEINWKVEF